MLAQHASAAKPTTAAAMGRAVSSCTTETAQLANPPKPNCAQPYRAEAAPAFLGCLFNNCAVVLGATNPSEPTHSKKPTTINPKFPLVVPACQALANTTRAPSKPKAEPTLMSGVVPVRFTKRVEA